MGLRSSLEDVILVGVVIAAGCEPCAEQAVDRALGRGVPADLIRRTLGIVAGIRAQDCFLRAVGPDVVARMEKPLEAGRKTLGRSARAPGVPGCCEAPSGVR